MTATTARKPPTFESRVRGLLLGLALGDAVGSLAGTVPSTGTLPAGAGSQLAAWTTEGLLRAATRYGGWVIGNPTGTVQYAYQRWAFLRGGARPVAGRDWGALIRQPDSEKEYRGWLIDAPVMAEQRGSSPTTLAALVAGRPEQSRGCQATLRVLPVAAFVGQRGVNPPSIADIVRHAQELSELTHAHRDATASAGAAAAVVAHCFTSSESFTEVMGVLVSQGWMPMAGPLGAAAELARSEPCVPSTLSRLAPDKSGVSALTGGVYVAASFPEPDSVADALMFAGRAPDGDSVAAVAGALLGALHGFEALPQPLVERLELGWVSDRLARDLALQVTQNQAGPGWKSDSLAGEPLDPWWDTKYPGV